MGPLEDHPQGVGGVARFAPHASVLPPRSRNKVAVAVLIAARGGSKGIPGKNLADLGGLPLIAHSILAARRATLVDRVFVSTDSPEIADIAVSFGAEVPVLRPPELAGDQSNPLFAKLHILDYLEKSEGYKPRIQINLQPTSPFRNPLDIDKAVEIMISGSSGVSSFVPLGGMSRYILIRSDRSDQRPEPIRFFNAYRKVPRRAFAPSGYLSATRYAPRFDPTRMSEGERARRCNKYNTALNNLGLGRSPCHYLLVDWVKGLDIDEPEDLEFARYLYASGLSNQAIQQCAQTLSSSPA